MQGDVKGFGQSMGATAAVVASSRPELQGKIACLLLWVSDPVISYNKQKEEIFEEEGQKYKGKFWQEAKQADFLACLRNFKRGMHLVYGEYDRYVSKEERNKVIAEVKRKSQQILILKGQNHSPWKYDAAQNVYREELKILQKWFIG